MVSIDDHRKKDGGIDWDSYRKAQVASGEACRECGSFIVFGRGVPRLCGSCSALHQDEGDVSHEYRLRCPKCRHLWKVGTDEYDLHQEGTHEVMCPECEHEFDIQTSVSFSFTSPKLMEVKL